MRPFAMVPLDAFDPAKRSASMSSERPEPTPIEFRTGTPAGTATPWVTLTGRHDTRREGLTLGVVVATAIWVWIALVDLIVGQPFHTFTLLGGIAGFTVMHYLLNAAYGIVIVSAVHKAVHAPSAIFGLGDLAWLRVFGGNLVGVAIAIAILVRRHPLIALLHEAENER